MNSTVVFFLSQNAEKESHRSDKETWSESKTCLEQEAAELRSKLLNVEHSLGQKNQRCLELNTISEKYLTQKIGKVNQ